MAYRRGAVNTILDSSIYQRGQIMTWQPDKKQKLFDEYNIQVVVNFWPKIDADLASMDLKWYWYIPNIKSIGMLDDHIQLLASTLADLLMEEDVACLILCEAGKTRSVFFSILVLAHMNDWTFKQAYEEVERILPNHCLKGFMLDFLNAN